MGQPSAFIRVLHIFLLDYTMKQNPPTKIEKQNPKFTKFTMKLFFMLPFLLMQSTGCSACIDTERTALLAFKSKLKDPHNLLLTWKGQNCCSWKGVTCHNQSSQVVRLNLHYPNVEPYGARSFSLNGEISSSLLSLRNLTHLDLSGNSFNETEIPKFIGQFENLEYLNLSSTKFVGKIPTEIGNLKRLRFLDMSQTFVRGTIPPQLGNISTLSFLSFRYNGLPEIENIEWISRLNSLQYLDLTLLDLSSSTNWFHALNKLNNLKVLILEYCNLPKVPAYIVSLNLTNLTTLDLSYNWFESPVPSWLGNLTSISHLDLSNAGFHGLSSGFWSKSQDRICHLRYLDFSRVNITGDITDFVRKFACSWKIIEVLSLANNYLHGSLLTGWLPEMQRLTHLDLQQNSITGSLSLIVNISKLSYLDLSNNLLEDTISQNLLENLTQLQVLDLSLNMLKLAIDNHWLPKFQLTELALQSCDVGPSFPSWLESQTQIYYLNLQNSSINDGLPSWFWRPSYGYIDLSYNNLHGKLPQSLQMPNLVALILASNNLGGPIRSLIANDLSIIDISHNKFVGTLQWVSNQSYLSSLSVKGNLFIGKIPSSICEMVFLSSLDLSHNKFSARIPNCMWKMNALQTLDMSFNNLSGTIPNSIGSMVNLISLILHDNIITGDIPESMKQCKNLILLDLGKNKLTGSVPKWIGTSLQNLAYLQLRENNFHGKIPSELALLQNLQVLDIASNDLEGSIPDSFGNFSAMTSLRNDGYWLDSTSGVGPDATHELSYTYVETLALVTKGEIIEYSKNLYFMNSIDLSCNNLSGSVPNGIVALKALENLDLSRNNFNGQIPEEIGKIKSLDSLDLSFNKLSGEIPQSMSELTFLSHLNLSYNNLSGQIPVGNQLNTLNDISIYYGNIFLCGAPVNLSCSIELKEHNISNGKSSIPHNLWLYFSIGAGFVVGWWVVWCILQLQGPWSTIFFEKVDYLNYNFSNWFCK